MAHLKAIIDHVDSYTARLIMAAAARAVGHVPSSLVLTDPAWPQCRVVEIDWTPSQGGALEAVRQIQGYLTRQGIRIHELELNGQRRNPRDIWQTLDT